MLAFEFCEKRGIIKDNNSAEALMHPTNVADISAAIDGSPRRPLNKLYEKDAYYWASRGPVKPAGQ